MSKDDMKELLEDIILALKSIKEELEKLRTK